MDLTACRSVLWFDQRSFGGTYVTCLLVVCAPSPCARASPPAAPTGTETRMVNNVHPTRRWDGGGMQGAKATRYNYNPRDRGQYVRLQEATGGASSGDPPATKLNYTDECDAPIVAGGGGVLGAGRRAKRGSNVSLIA